MIHSLTHSVTSMANKHIKLEKKNVGVHGANNKILSCIDQKRNDGVTVKISVRSIDY